MNRRTGSLVNRRIALLVVVLVVAVSLAVHGAFSQASPSSNRKAINLPDDSPKAPSAAPFSQGIRFTYRDALALIRKPETPRRTSTKKSNCFWIM